MSQPPQETPETLATLFVKEVVRSLENPHFEPREKDDLFIQSVKAQVPEEVFKAFNFAACINIHGRLSNLKEEDPVRSARQAADYQDRDAALQPAIEWAENNPNLARDLLKKKGIELPTEETKRAFAEFFVSEIDSTLHRAYHEPHFNANELPFLKNVKAMLPPAIFASFLAATRFNAEHFDIGNALLLQKLEELHQPCVAWAVAYPERAMDILKTVNLGQRGFSVGSRTAGQMAKFQDLGIKGSSLGGKMYYALQGILFPSSRSYGSIGKDLPAPETLRLK